MAIYHFSVGHVSRSTGCSAVQSAAYITGEKLHEMRRGLTANYSNRDDVAYAETLAPAWANEKFTDTGQAWNLLENYEDTYAITRYKTPETQEKYLQSARTAMKIVVALPRELTAETHKELVLDFVNKNYVSKGHIVTLGLHAEEGNPHAHLQISRRQIQEDGSISYSKNREMCSVLGLKKQRELWANTVNHYLEREGLDVRIDHRSYKDQGLDLIPTTHEGWYARKLEDQGIESRTCSENRSISEENQQRVSQYPELIFKELNTRKATFSELDVLKVVQNRTQDHPELAQHVFESVMEKAIPIGHGFDRQSRFTSPEYHAKETELMEQMERLSGTSVDRKISPLAVQSQLNHQRFLGDKISEEQEKAVHTLCSDSAFSVLVGRAGTGKTSAVLKPVVALHEGAGYKVMGMALAAEAAKNLAIETGCKAETIAYYAYQWKKIPQLEAALESSSLSVKERDKIALKLESAKETLPTKNTVMIIDEAGMVGTKDWHLLVSTTQQTGAKLIVCGDDHQYKAIDAGDVFRKSMEVAARHNCKAEVSVIFRQGHEWMRHASMNLAQLETTTALMAYENRGHIREANTHSDMIKYMAGDYLEKVKTSPQQSGIVLTSTNDVRLALNQEIRQGLQREGLLGHDILIHKGKKFAIGDQIIFLENDRHQSKVVSESGGFAVKNGTRGILEAVKMVEINDDAGTSKSTVVPQLMVRINDSERVKFTLKDYENFDHAYAVTGHKSQGQTVDWTIAHLSKNLDAYGLYVMMTRHRQDLILYHNKEEVASFTKFADNIRVGYKDLVQDYSIREENQEYYFNVEDYKALGREILQTIKEKNASREEGVKVEQISTDPILYKPSVEELLKERKELARLIVEDKEAHKLYVMQAGLTFEKLEITAGLKARPLTFIEQKAQTTVEQYALVAQEARDLWRDIRRTAPGSAAKNHPEYQRFNELRQERGSLANMIIEAPILHRPFLKEVTKDLGYGFSTIQKQAEAFQSTQLQKTLKENNPDRATTKQLETLTAYVEARDQFGQLWKDLKPQLKKSEGTLLKASLSNQVQELRDISFQRDKLAYQIVEKFEDYNSLAKSVQVTLDTSKLFDQAENGLRQSCIEQYQHSDSQLAKSMAAYELSELWNQEKEEGLKTTVRELLHNKINLLELRATAHQFERTQIYASLERDQDKQLFKSLDHYQVLKEAANDHYKICLEDAKEKEIKPWESAYYPAFAAISVERDNAANNLIKQSYPEVSDLAQKMHISLKTLDQEAHRHDLRQNSEVFLSGMGAKSVYAAKELQAWLDFDRETGSRQTISIMAEMQYLPKDLAQHIKEKEAAFTQAAIVKREEYQTNITTGKQLHIPNLNESLKEKMSELSHEILGDPTSRSSTQLRYGRKGSIAVLVNGPQKGLYSNFETGVHGGPLKMVEEQLKISPDEAKSWAKEWLGQAHEKIFTHKEIIREGKETKESSWAPILPVPPHAEKPDIAKNPYLSYMMKDREIKATYDYKNEQGQLLGCVVRLEDKDGSKITPTLTYCQNEQGQQHWRWKGFEGTRPLYGLDRLEKDKPVLIVEGEKTADAAQKMLPDYAVLSWHGGAGAVAKADWSLLVGKDIIIWPDNDAPGIQAAEKITDTLQQLNELQGTKAQVKSVDLPNDIPEKWDLADKLPENLTIDKVKNLIEQPQGLIHEASAIPAEKDWAKLMAEKRQEIERIESQRKDIHKAIDPKTALYEQTLKTNDPLSAIKNVLQENSSYNVAPDMAERVYQAYTYFKGIIADGQPLNEKDNLHLVKQCVFAVGQSLIDRQIMRNDSPLASRNEAENTAWRDATKIKHTNCLKIEAPYERMEHALAFNNKWDQAIGDAASKITFAYPGMDSGMAYSLAQESIIIANILRHHRTEAKAFILGKGLDIQENNQVLMTQVTALSRHQKTEEHQNIKDLLVKEMLTQKDTLVSCLSDNISKEAKQEQQRVNLLQERALMQQRQMDLQNQRTL